MPIDQNQRTLTRAVSFSGVGLHSGHPVRLTIKPAPENHGIKFKRVDLPDTPCIAALFRMVVDTSLATVIGSNGAIVSTIEHLMASFAGICIDNALVELDAYEIPVMDGSAAPFIQSMLEAGITEQQAPRYGFIVKKPIEIEKDGKFVGIYPSNRFKITCTIDFSHPMIQKQTYVIELTPESFAQEISRARTFGFLRELELMKHHGLARGGSLENAVVLDDKEVINPEGLRFSDEFVRHKVLDCIGDFSLLGMPFLGHVMVNKSGHAFNHSFLSEFFSSKQSWDTAVLIR
jgi:UDP-3-O-[3-hydroxymyristoyl] N-acetylglucosamine deacetylase